MPANGSYVRYRTDSQYNLLLNQNRAYAREIEEERYGSVRPGFLGSDHSSDANARELRALLDTMVALRMDLGHDANGVAASPPLGPSQMRAMRLTVDGAIRSIKDVIGLEGPSDYA